MKRSNEDLAKKEISLKKQRDDLSAELRTNGEHLTTLHEITRLTKENERLRDSAYNTDMELTGVTEKVRKDGNEINSVIAEFESLGAFSDEIQQSSFERQKEVIEEVSKLETINTNITLISHSPKSTFSPLLARKCNLRKRPSVLQTSL